MTDHLTLKQFDRLSAHEQSMLKCVRLSDGSTGFVRRAPELVSRTLPNGVAVWVPAGSDLAGAPQKLSDEDYAKLTSAEKLSYARQFSSPVKRG